MMRIYPPTAYRQLSITSGGVDEFMNFFTKLRSRWVKVEFLQEYDESGFAGYEAFRNGNYAEAERLVQDMVRGQEEVYCHATEHEVDMVRIRVCELPLSHYLTHYEIAAYLADIECGEDIRFVDAQEIQEFLADTGVSDFVLFDDQRVVTLIYDLETSSLREARLVEDPMLVKAYSKIVDFLLQKSTPMLESPIYLEVAAG